jgi:adenylyltransferase/sulfurtransferase
MSDEISVRDLKARIDGGADFVLLDVREPFEIDTASLPGAVAIPMDAIAARIGELPREKEIAVLCHSGYRSGRVAGFLRQAGFKRVVNVAGGIDAWSIEIDQTVPRY